MKAKKAVVCVTLVGAPAGTQVAINQGAAQATQAPAIDVRTEIVEELSRLEAVFNLDPIRRPGQQQAGAPQQSWLAPGA